MSSWSVGVLVAVALVALVFLLRSAGWGRLLRGRASRPLLLGALIGALVTATAGLLLTGASEADPEHTRDVFRAIALPGNEPPGLTDVRLVESPTNGLEMSVQQGTELVYVCFGTPDQVRNGSCATPETELIRERRPGDGDIRVERIVRFVGLPEEKAKADPTAAAETVATYWRESALFPDPNWLGPWLER